MEEGVVAHGWGIGFEVLAALFDVRLDLGEPVEVPVDDGFVGEPPEMLGRLQFGGVGREVYQPHALGHAQAWLGVPAGAVEEQDDGAPLARAGLAGEEREQSLEERFGDPVADIPVALPRGRRHEGGDVEPFVAVVTAGDGLLPARGPDPAGDGLQPDAVLVRAEERDRPAGMAGFLLGEGRGEFFLKAACASGPAAARFLGRGAWIDQPIACKASQARCG
jgi:hypothetical protein